MFAATRWVACRPAIDSVKAARGKGRSHMSEAEAQRIVCRKARLHCTPESARFAEAASHCCSSDLLNHTTAPRHRRSRRARRLPAPMRTEPGTPVALANSPKVAHFSSPLQEGQFAVRPFSGRVSMPMWVHFPRPLPPAIGRLGVTRHCLVYRALRRVYMHRRTGGLASHSHGLARSPQTEALQESSCRLTEDVDRMCLRQSTGRLRRAIQRVGNP